MIIDDKKAPSVSTLTGEAAEFRIATNAKAFRVLVDGIYADKIGSIVRELLSNAFDAHVRRGNSHERFEVRVPNGLNPTFSVRDYGCSMDHEFVMSSYSTLFESSKANSNDEVGAFGLGAKSFLAYTDACTLTCWLDGEVRSYSIALADSGVPQVRLVHRAPSDKPQGVEVTFAVAREDFTAFATAVTGAVYGLDTVPIVHGAPVEVADPIHSGEGWRLFSKPDGLRHGSVMVRQGCAIYPAPYGTSPLQNSYEVHRFVLVVDTPIGTANVTASRESLALTNDQRLALRERIAKAEEQVHESVRAQYRALDTDLARARFADANLPLLGSGDWPTFVKIPYSIPGWTGEGLRPQDVFRVRTMPTMLLLIDDGTPIKRRVMRLRALSRQGRALFVVKDQGTADEVRALLDLAEDQVMPLSSIPDVPPPKRTKPATPRVTKQVSADRVWAISNRNTAYAGPMCWDRSAGGLFGNMVRSTAAVTDWVGKALKSVTTNPEILWLTPKEADRAVATGKVRESMRLDNVLLAAMRAENMRAKALAIETRAALRSRLHHSSVTEEMAKRAGVISLDSTPGEIMPIWAALSRADHDVVRKQAHSIVAGLAEKFPLLFGYDVEAARTYIEMCERA